MVGGLELSIAPPRGGVKPPLLPEKVSERRLHSKLRIVNSQILEDGRRHGRHRYAMQVHSLPDPRTTGNKRGFQSLAERQIAVGPMRPVRLPHQVAGSATAKAEAIRRFQGHLCCWFGPEVGQTRPIHDTPERSLVAQGL